MDDLLPFLKSLLEVSGLSAHEGPVRRRIEARWKPLADELQVSRLGSLHALKKGSGDSPRPSLLAAAHMDAIGLMVQSLHDGFLRLAAVGDADPRLLPGTPVRVHTAGGDLPGVVSLPPPRLLPEEQRGRFPALKYLFVDTGLTPAQVKRRVQTGDLVSLDTQPVELAGGVLSGHSLDNRASVAALTFALEELRSRSHRWDVWAAATVQEETTMAGAATSAFGLRPDLAVVLDVTFAKGPGTDGWDSFPLDSGPTLGLGPVIHPALHRRFREAAERAEIPFSVEPMPAYSMTDADAILTAAGGIPCMVLGIPIRYMHSPVEAACLRDIERAGRLLAEFIVSLEGDFLRQVVWE